MRRLVLIRHGITAWNLEGRWQGRLDPPLSDAGRREADLVAARVAADPALRPTRIVSSSLARAAETARIIGDAVGMAVETDDRLVEVGAGEWEGHTHAELEAADGDRYRAWRRTPEAVPPGGEAFDSVVARTRAALDDVGGDASGPTLVVSHGGILRVVARLLFGLSHERTWALDVDNASISVAGAIGGAWRLERWNDERHLLGREATHVDEAEGRPLAL
jgi:probable phosphoglycerate mutase